LDKEDRWDKYIKDNLEREEQNLEKIDPMVGEFAEILKKEAVKRVLDLGCGLGRHAIYLATLGFHTVGLDISEETLRRAEEIAEKKKLHIDFVRGDFLDLPFFDGAFGGIVTVNTIYHDHLENILMALREIHRVLAPDGLVCLNTYSVRDGLFGSGRKLGKQLFLIHRIPHYFFEENEIKYILEQLFFKVESIQTDTGTAEQEGKIVKREKYKIIARKMARKNKYNNLSPITLY